MSDLNTLLQNVEASFANRNSLAYPDKPGVELVGVDPLIERLAKEYIESKYHFLIKDAHKSLHPDLILDKNKYMQFLVQTALDNDIDIRIFDRGDVHFKVNATRVATHDLVRHWSMRFKQTGQSKQIDLNIQIPDEEAKKLIQQVRYFIPPEWGQKAPELAAEFNSTMNYIANFVKRAVDTGMPTNQAKYIFTNATTTELDISGNLRGYYNLVGLRTCGGAQFENKYSASQMAKFLKIALPNLTQKLGPRCVYVGRCLEGDSCCGEFGEMKDIFSGSASSKLMSWLENLEDLMETHRVLEFNNSDFVENYKIAFEEVQKLKETNSLPAIIPSFEFVEATPNLERRVAEGAVNTYKRLQRDKLPKDLELSDELIGKVCRTVARKVHYGSLQQGSLMYDFKISRVLWHKFVRHWSLNPIASSQHHTKHSNFEYVMPPAWQESGMDLEFHTLMRVLNNLYERAMEAGIDKANARYCISINAVINARLSGNPRSLYSVARQRSCPTNSWEEQFIVKNWARDLKKNWPDLFYYVGPPCLTDNCSKPYLGEEKINACKADAKAFFEVTK